MPTSPIPVFASSDRMEVERVLARRALRLEEAERTVARVVASVRREGDKALLQYARRWDAFPGRSAAEMAVSRERMAQAWREMPAAFRRAVREAQRNIRAFCRLQMPAEWRRTIRKGIRLGQLVRPLESVGCYVPSGRYPLPSTLLMTVVPAKVAGVKRLVVCTPRPSAEILAVAHALGVKELYAVGGAQAIAAMAYGTETVAPVSKIVGPGNAYVAAAKRLVSRDAAIEFVAGPTEVLVICDKGNPAWLAADLLAQAEHDVDAAALLLTTSRKLAREVAEEVRRQLESLPARRIATAALRSNSAIIVVRRREEAIALMNRFAPEHLCVPSDFPLAAIESAGSVFVGEHSPEAAGDYASGPNHVLPTGGMSRVRGGLSVLDFVKIISVQELREEGLRSLAAPIVSLARAEGLEAHARSVEIRLESASSFRSARQRSIRK